MKLDPTIHLRRSRSSGCQREAPSSNSIVRLVCKRTAWFLNCQNLFDFQMSNSLFESVSVCFSWLRAKEPDYRTSHRNGAAEQAKITRRITRLTKGFKEGNYKFRISESEEMTMFDQFLTGKALNVQHHKWTHSHSNELRTASELLLNCLWTASGHWQTSKSIRILFATAEQCAYCLAQ